MQILHLYKRKSWQSLLVMITPRFSYGLVTVISAVLSLYVLTPTFTRLIFGSTMFSNSSKRSDKYTTGLINNRNDCFANSSVQALASLPKLTSYLNDVLKQACIIKDMLDNEKQSQLTDQVDEEQDIIDHGLLTPKVELAVNPMDPASSIDRQVDRPLITQVKSTTTISTLQDGSSTAGHTPAMSTAEHSLDENVDEADHSDSTSSAIPTMLMHRGLARIVAQLQETITTSKHITVWPLLRILEIIFNAKISKGQNDAHEITQIILETLQKENLKLQDFAKNHKLAVIIPEFPVKGKIADHLVCLRCQNSSQVNVHPFIIYPLNVPQTFSAKLSDMVSDNQTDTIEGYSCLTCKVSAILANEKNRGFDGCSEEEKNILKTLDGALPNLFINDDISKDLLNYIDSYNKDGCIINDLKSTIVKKTVAVESPQILIMHLSRSMFNGMTYSRNSCAVSFDEILDTKEQIISNNRCVGINHVSYKLKAIVKHAGSHSQGHYECYRHKPDFVKDITAKTVINRSPVIDVNLIDANNPTNTTQSTDNVNALDNRREKETFLDSNFSLNSDALRVPLKATGSSDDDYVIPNNDSSKVSRKPSALQKITGFLSRRSSVSTESDDLPPEVNVSRSRAGSLAMSQNSRSRAGSIASTSMEKTSSIGSQSSFFSSSEGTLGTTSASEVDGIPGEKKILKKIKSVSKYPYWHLSDAIVKEAKTDEVLSEVRYVYMLYYERMAT